MIMIESTTTSQPVLWQTQHYLEYLKLTLKPDHRSRKFVNQICQLSLACGRQVVEKLKTYPVFK